MLESKPEIVAVVAPVILALKLRTPDAGVANMSYAVAPGIEVHERETDAEVCSGLETVGTLIPEVVADVNCTTATQTSLRHHSFENDKTKNDCLRQ